MKSKVVHLPSPAPQQGHEPAPTVPEGGEIAPDMRLRRPERRTPRRVRPEVAARMFTIGPWLNSEEAAAYCRKPSRAAFRVWAARKGIVAVNLDAIKLFARADIDRALGLALVADVKRRIG